MESFTDVRALHARGRHRALTPLLSIQSTPLIRRVAHAWRYGELAASVLKFTSIALAMMLAASIWQGYRLRAEMIDLQSRADQLQARIAAKSSSLSAAESPDFVQALPDAPTAVQVMQTLQQAADMEGGIVTSLQAEDHPPTESTLGRLDLVISVKATYPAILIVVREALDRYPGATLRQFTLARATSSTVMASTTPAPQPGTTSMPSNAEAEAHVVLSLWSRPLGVPRTLAAPAAMPAAAHSTAPSGRSSSDEAQAASAAGDAAGAQARRAH